MILMGIFLQLAIHKSSYVAHVVYGWGAGYNVYPSHPSGRHHEGHMQIMTGKYVLIYLPSPSIRMLPAMTIWQALGHVFHGYASFKPQSVNKTLLFIGQSSHNNTQYK